MHTGDLATIDAEGYCRIVGRCKDMIIRGGENIYPAEIEQHLHRHAAVGQVAVFGVPDEKLGEIVCAWIVAKAGQSVSAEELAQFCRSRIAHYKVPAHIRLVEQMPATVTGKLQKYLMRQAMAQQLGIPEQAAADDSTPD
jgi:fatty-acyl-CoA synthase